MCVVLQMFREILKGVKQNPVFLQKECPQVDSAGADLSGNSEIKNKVCTSLWTMHQHLHLYGLEKLTSIIDKYIFNNNSLNQDCGAKQHPSS